MKDEEKLNLPVAWPEKLTCEFSAELAKLPVHTFQLSGMPDKSSPHYRMVVVFKENSGIPDYDSDGFEFPTAEAVLEDVKKHVKSFNDLKSLTRLLHHFTGYSLYSPYLAVTGNYVRTADVINEFEGWRSVALESHGLDRNISVTPALIERYLKREPGLIRVVCAGQICWHALKPGYSLYVPEPEKEKKLPGGRGS